MTHPKWWDFTLSKEKAKAMYIDDIATLGEFLSKKCDRVVVGDEVGEGGYEHFQGRCVFKKGMDISDLVVLLPTAHWTPTHVRNFDYCEKEGKFWRSWETALRDFQCLELYGWQRTALEDLKKQNDRQVMVIVDGCGGVGKTWLAKHLVATHQGAYCPAMDESRDYMAWALAHSTARMFVIDIPKSDSRKKNSDLWSAIEQMKNGYLWDKRNHWQEKWIDPPKILVITNEEPDRNLLSPDRWDIRYIGLDNGHPTLV